DVPSYMYFTSKGMFTKAFAAILQTNPFPNVQGMVCDHPCTQKCTRINYDNPLQIREIKRFIAQTCDQHPELKPPELQPLEDNHLKAAVIGGGPSGFSAAYFLKMNGFSVDLFEAKKFGGGMAADAIPSFRLDDLSIKTDIDRIISLGVKVHYEKQIDEDSFGEIKNKFDYVYIAVGAKKAFQLDVPGADVKGVWDQLEFLSCVRQNNSMVKQKNIVVIGGGNSAMDAARAAKRLAGKDGTVTILYRRSIKQMPADLEEIDAVIEEGIQIHEMAAPKSVLSENGNVTGIQCYKMELGKPDSSGRPRPVVIEGSDFVIDADTIISAIGQQVVIPFLKDHELNTDPETFQTNIEKVYAGGDAIRGASTLIKAIADGQKAVQSMVTNAKVSGNIITESAGFEKDTELLANKIAQRVIGKDTIETDLSKRNGFDLVIGTMTKEMAIEEASRCLSCDTICNICTTVCPNRANVSYKVKPFSAQTYSAISHNNETKIEKKGIFTVSQEHQVINIGDFCNECGNCTTFCPSSGSPYIEKPKFYLSLTDFQKESFGYFMDHHSICKRSNDQQVSLTETENVFVYESNIIKATLNKQNFNVEDVEFKDQAENQKEDLSDAAELGFLYQSLKGYF
ncbi:FAD-dependent oxidoreductase, partial [bacterium]|nr:FAD-dependent oxidoreductase [bacterium]